MYKIAWLPVNKRQSNLKRDNDSDEPLKMGEIAGNYNNFLPFKKRYTKNYLN